MEINHWLVDNSVISNFAQIGKLELLKEKLGGKLCIPEEVKSEFLMGIKKGVIPERDISWMKVIERIESEDKLFDRLCFGLGRGESACLAIAVERKWELFTDDVDARNTAQRFEVPVSGTIRVRNARARISVISKQILAVMDHIEKLRLEEP